MEAGGANLKLVTIEGTDPITVCAMPAEALTVENEVLDNQKSVKDNVKDDMDAYNAEMLENFHKFFYEKVESKSGSRMVVTPAEEGGCASPRALPPLGPPSRARDSSRR